MSARKPSAEANLRWNLRRRLNDKQYRAAIRNLRAAKAEAAERAAIAFMNWADDRGYLSDLDIRAAVMSRPKARPR